MKPHDIRGEMLRTSVQLHCAVYATIHVDVRTS